MLVTEAQVREMRNVDQVRGRFLEEATALYEAREQELGAENMRELVKHRHSTLDIACWISVRVAFGLRSSNALQSLSRLVSDASSFFTAPESSNSPCPGSDLLISF